MVEGDKLYGMAWTIGYAGSWAAVSPVRPCRPGPAPVTGLRLATAMMATLGLSHRAVASGSWLVLLQVSHPPMAAQSAPPSVLHHRS